MRPIRRDSGAANLPGQLCRQSAGREARPIRRCCHSAGTAVRGQLCGQFDGTEARPICRDSCVVNPPGQLCGQSAGIAAPPIRRDSLRTIRPDSSAGDRGAANPGNRGSGAGTAVRPIRWDRSAANPPGQLCGQSAGTAVQPTRRDNGAANPAGPGQQCWEQKRGQSGQQGQPCGDSRAANSMGQQRGQSAGTVVWRPTRRDNGPANTAGQLAADPPGQQCGGPMRGQSGPQGQRCGDSCAANPAGQQRGQSAGTAVLGQQYGQSVGTEVLWIWQTSDGLAMPAAMNQSGYRSLNPLMETLLDSSS